MTKATLIGLFCVGLISIFHIHFVFGGEIRVTNNCGYNVRVGYTGSDNGAFSLNPGGSQTFQLQNGNVHGRTSCDGNGNGCDTNGNIISLAEMHWDPDGHTWYDISQVNGYNIPMTLAPYNSGAGGNCRTVNCNFNMNNCPEDLKVRNGAGQLVACQSACRAYPDQGYCDFGGPIAEYSYIVKASCPNVYTYPADNAAGMCDCISGNNGLTVTFC